MRRNKSIEVLGIVMLAAAVLTGCSSTPQQASPQKQVVMDQRAMTLLRQMSDTLTQADGYSFSAMSSESVASPGGEWVHVFGTSRVTFKRQGGLLVETGGDLFPHKLYYDGTTATLYAPNENLYVQEHVANTVDGMLQQLFSKHGDSYAFADMIQSDPYLSMSQQTSIAELVGTSTLNGVQTNHIAFTGHNMQWEIWIGADDHLPRMLNVMFLDIKGGPANTVSFFDWKLNPEVSADTFAFKPPQGAVRIEHLKPPESSGAPASPAPSAPSAPMAALPSPPTN
jgi:hypothetical protein